MARHVMVFVNGRPYLGPEFRDAASLYEWDELVKWAWDRHQLNLVAGKDEVVYSLHGFEVATATRPDQPATVACEPCRGTGRVPVVTNWTCPVCLKIVNKSGAWEFTDDTHTRVKHIQGSPTCAWALKIIPGPQTKLGQI